MGNGTQGEGLGQGVWGNGKGFSVFEKMPKS